MGFNTDKQLNREGTNRSSCKDCMTKPNKCAIMLVRNIHSQNFIQKNLFIEPKLRGGKQQHVEAYQDNQVGTEETLDSI